ncbi:MAG: class I SAM-dependent methyltransferase [Candidatus Electrothrix sp. ATG2]|nr:class I SAM-dependent methyltransferase [Candidatus Electrothrix sp. ATG2]
MSRETLFQYHLARGVRDSFAGTRLPSDYDAGSLYECSLCGLQFRHPTINKKEMLNLYSELDPVFWQMSQSLVWTRIKNIIERYSPNNRLLDFGCFSGEFLKFLGNDWERYGVEPSRVAAENAKNHAIEVWNRVEEIPLNNFFGVILLMDVFEHLSNPYEILSHLVGKLEPDGVLVLLSGNSRALSWQIMRGDYWYLSMPEHICFLNQKWLDWFCHVEHVHLMRTDHISIAHENLFIKTKQITANLLYKLSNCKYIKLLKKALLLVPLVKKILLWKMPIPWTTAQDHLLVVIRRNYNE